MMALVIAMVMVVAMSGTAFASGDPATPATPVYSTQTINVTVNDNEHTQFNAIQIFAGTSQDNSADDQALGNITWADDVSGKENDIITAVNSALGLSIANGTAAKDVAKAIADANPNTEASEKLAKALYEKLKSITGTELNKQNNQLPIGWYLVVDKSTLGNNDAYNAAVLQFTRDITINKKTDAPSQEKKVKEDTTYTEKSGYNDVADYDIGEEVPFQITSRIPDISKYTKYEMTFTDTMSAGLDFTESSIKVKIGNTEYDASQIAENAKIVLTPNQDKHGFTLKLILKKQNVDELSGTNTAIFAKDADITIDFTAKLNTNATIGLNGNTNKSKLTYTNSPNATNENDSTKDTPEDTVIVFTYELDVTKVDGQNSNTKLEGAEFILKNSAGKFAQCESDGETFKAWVNSENDATTFTSPSGGTFKIKGLDEGTYHLKETKAPTGYNLLTDEIELVISAEYIADRQAWTSGTASEALTATKLKVGTADAAASSTVGVLATDVQNNKGAVLPSTGGRGTTMLYIIGAILVVGAGVLLVTRRRMRAE